MENEMNEDIEIILENSNVAPTDEILIGLISARYNTSLLSRISDTLPITGAIGHVYANKKKFSSIPGFEIVRKQIEPTIRTLDTGYTKEVLDDMNNMFKKKAKDMTLQVLKGITDNEENITLMTLLDTECSTKNPLVMPVGNGNDFYIPSITAKVSESVLEMNHHQFQTLDSFCILPRRYAAMMLGYFDFATTTDTKEKYLFVGKYGRTEFYLDPRPVSGAEFTNDEYDDGYTIVTPSSKVEYCYVGLKGIRNGTNSSLIYSPHSYEKKMVVDPKTGENTLFLYNRYDLVTAPLHLPLEGSSLLHKFQISIA